MKRTIFFVTAILLVLVWWGSAWADACISYERYDTYELSQGDVNKLGRDGVIYDHPVYGTIELAQYNSAPKQYDIQSVQEAYRCINWPLTDPDSLVGEIVVYGLSLSQAQILEESWYDPDTNDLIKESNFGISEVKMPGNIKNLLDSNVHLEMNCSDLVQWMDKKSNLADLGITCDQ